MRHFNPIRWFISHLARLTPGVYYYAADIPVSVRGHLERVSSQKWGEQSPASIACTSVACGFAELLPEVGDTCTADITGVTHGNRDIGSFHITVTRTEA